VTNTLAYYEHSLIMDVKKFYDIGPKPNVLKTLFVSKTRSLHYSGQLRGASLVLVFALPTNIRLDTLGAEYFVSMYT
jgi:hypothetical protein